MIPESGFRLAEEIMLDRTGAPEGLQDRAEARGKDGGP